MFTTTLTGAYIPTINGGWWKPNSWMIYFMENPRITWMMTGGTPISGNPHIYIYVSGKFVVNKKGCLMIFGLERNVQIGLTGNGN